MLALRDHKPSPKEQRVLARQPPFDAQVQICVNAWDTLESARPYYLRPVPVPKAAPVLMPFRGEIPWPAIEQYGRLHCMSREAVVLLVEVIAGLDAKRSEREQNELKRRSPR